MTIISPRGRCPTDEFSLCVMSAKTSGLLFLPIDYNSVETEVVSKWNINEDHFLEDGDANTPREEHVSTCTIDLSV